MSFVQRLTRRLDASADLMTALVNFHRLRHAPPYVRLPEDHLEGVRFFWSYVPRQGRLHRLVFGIVGLPIVCLLWWVNPRSSSSRK